MKVREKLLLESDGLAEYGPINIVIFGDSISHGAFNDYIDYEKVYWNLLRKKLNDFRNYVPVNMINASIGGTNATRALGRFEKQVLIHEPDLIIVCFGLNDVNHHFDDYIASLRSIFEMATSAGRELIFMTPNMLNTYVAEDTPKHYLEHAKKTAENQTNGRMDKFIYSAIELAQSMGITVCDCYSKWKEISKTQDTTMLLDNRINHPIPEMHELFAQSLYEIIMKEY